MLFREPAGVPFHLFESNQIVWQSVSGVERRKKPNDQVWPDWSIDPGQPCLEVLAAIQLDLLCDLGVRNAEGLLQLREQPGVDFSSFFKEADFIRGLAFSVIGLFGQLPWTETECKASLPKKTRKVGTHQRVLFKMPAVMGATAGERLAAVAHCPVA